MLTKLDGDYWWHYGEIGQKIVELTKFKNIPEGLEIIDGHEPHEFSNLDIEGLVKPQHLDIVGVDKETNEVKFICEVKTTANKTKKEFRANGLCQVFMKLAQQNKIPLYFAVVRLDRMVDRSIVFEKNGEVFLDEDLFEKEIKHFLETAKVEFYTENEFLMVNNNFIINS